MFDNDVTDAPAVLNSAGKGMDVEAPCPGCGCLVTQTVPWSAIVRMYRREPIHPWRMTRRGYQIAYRCPTCPGEHPENPQCGWIVVDIGQDEVCEWQSLRGDMQSGT